MTLAAGSRLGPYEIVALIGAGGMGEVYRARDSKLNRDVALKILPEAFAADGERLARFRREAQILASFSHPNIGHIYGLEDSSAVQALVLELIAGETLADRIAPGPMPLTDALAIAKQIAEALEVAHEHGIVHRDLKPANIKVTPDGVVKVLDFGLAKGRGHEPSPDLTQSPTITIGDTRSGVVFGTAVYMSPEQARGQVVDKRTDIWAFGCVLYEMLTGRIAFKGDTVSDTIGAILRAEPEWDALPPATPAHVRLLLERCLEKDPKRRLRDIGDARIELDQPHRRISAAAVEAGQLPPSGAIAVGAPSGPSVRRRVYLASGLVGLTLVLLAGGAGILYVTTRSTRVTDPSEYVQLTNLPKEPWRPACRPTAGW
jgi:serine/threonine protein kinase